MAINNPSNQLLQIDTGSVLTYLYNPSQGALAPYAGIGENQILGQRFVGVNFNPTAPNPNGMPAVYMLVQMLATSAVTLSQWQLANAPAPVYWTDLSCTTVTAVKSEGWGGAAGLQDVAGYWMPNFASLPNVTLAQLLGGVGLIQVAGPLLGAFGPTSGGLAGNNINGAAGAFQSAGVATAPPTRFFGVQVTAVVAGLCNVLVNSDIF